MTMKTKTKKSKKEKKAASRNSGLSFTRRNYQLFIIGLLVLTIGFVFLSIGPWDSFWSRTLAPVILVIGYLVVIPWSILYQKKSNSSSK